MNTKSYNILQKKPSLTTTPVNDVQRNESYFGTYGDVRKKWSTAVKAFKQLRFINFTGIYKQLFTDASWVTEKKPKRGMTFGPYS